MLSVTKKPPAFIAVFCVRCFLSSIARTTSCSYKHLLKPERIQVSGITNSQCLGKRGGLGKAPGRGASSVLGLPVPRIVRSISGKGRAQPPKAQCRFSRHLCLSPRAPPLHSPLMLTVCIIIYCYQGIWFDQ